MENSSYLLFDQINQQAYIEVTFGDYSSNEMQKKEASIAEVGNNSVLSLYLKYSRKFGDPSPHRSFSYPSFVAFSRLMVKTFIEEENIELSYNQKVWVYRKLETVVGNYMNSGELNHSGLTILHDPRSTNPKYKQFINWYIGKEIYKIA
jgi:hypothetical protein